MQNSPVGKWAGAARKKEFHETSLLIVSPVRIKYTMVQAFSDPGILKRSVSASPSVKQSSRVVQILTSRMSVFCFKVWECLHFVFVFSHFSNACFEKTEIVYILGFPDIFELACGPSAGRLGAFGAGPLGPRLRRACGAGPSGQHRRQASEPVSPMSSGHVRPQSVKIDNIGQH